MLVLLSKGMSAFGKLGLNDWAPRFQEEMRIWADSYELEASDWSFRAALISSRQSCLRNVPSPRQRRPPPSTSHIASIIVVK
ncbi:hypothetical protein VTJ04DRAFT_4086 [Mycothermus thermophilus]|uniref:uncharacterized protein n=1 Tax=Humicola insolens TaxID=85995 RepID=UPI00374212FB